mgnify:CR=1 FL=1
MFIINCKNYNEISGEKINKLALAAERISKKYKIQIALAPPHHLLVSIKKSKLRTWAKKVEPAHANGQRVVRTLRFVTGAI